LTVPFKTLLLGAADAPREASPAAHWRRYNAGRFCLPVEQTRQKRVSYHAQAQTDYRPNETATYPRFGNSDDVLGGKSKEGAATKAKTNKDGSNQRREGENAAQLLAETAGSPEGTDRK
jgi:hypothetical protein